MPEGMLAEVIGIRGHNGDVIEAYYARPLDRGPRPGMVVIHHGPGFDDWSKEVYRKLASKGFAVMGPHLYSRHGPGSWDDVSATAHAKGEPGNASDAQVVGDIEASMAFLRQQPDANGKVGTIGFCSGGRQSYMAACRIPSLNAAVVCWGGNVVLKPGAVLTPEQPVAVIDLTKDIACPILGIFGNEDANPSPAAVNTIEAELTKHGKTYEFHRYDGAGHGFFAVDRVGYRPEQATDAWKKVFAFLDKNLRG